MTVMHAWYEVGQGAEVVLEGTAAVDELLTRVAAGSGATIISLYRVADLAANGMPSIDLLVGLGSGLDAGAMQCSDDGIWATSSAADSGWAAVSYSYKGTGHDLPGNAVLPLAQIREAVHEFAVTGRRPGAVAWQPLR